MEAIKVSVNGYGVIGKRVADAVALQPDMELVGVADVATDYRVMLAVGRSYRLFGSTAEATAGVTAAEPDAADSIALTDESLGIRAELIPRLAVAQARSTGLA